jgi:hypothetical protein
MDTLTNSSAQLTSLGKEVSNTVSDLAWLCVLIAFLTSAIVQLIKEHTKLRAWIHRSALDQWIRRRFAALEKATKNVRENSSHDHSKLAREQIENLCAAGSAGAHNFYSLPTDQFCGQLAHAIDVALVDPENCVDFSRIVFSIGTEGEVSLLLKDDNVRERAANHAQRALDDLQQSATRIWKIRLLIATLLTSLGVSFAATAITALTASGTSAAYFFYSILVLGVAGGLLAPIAYDLTSGLKRWGRR